jgi:hypothetical protein
MGREWPLHVWGQWDMYSRAMTVTVKKKSILRLRDISEDLDARIEALNKVIESEHADFTKRQEEAATEHRKKIEGLKRALVNYQQMRDIERFILKRTTEDQADVGPTQDVQIEIPTPRLPLAEFFISELRQRGEMSKEELREAAHAAKYFSEGDSGGRATHATLENIKRSNRILIAESGKYTVNTMEKALL